MTGIDLFCLVLGRSILIISIAFVTAAIGITIAVAISKWSRERKRP